MRKKFGLAGIVTKGAPKAKEVVTKAAAKAAEKIKKICLAVTVSKPRLGMVFIMSV